MFNEHTAIRDMMHDVALRHLAVAFDGENALIDEHVTAAKHDLSGYMRIHLDKVPTTKDAFDDWGGRHHLINAILTDTLGMTQDDITGSDDSWGDYIPDGLSQAQALTDDGYDRNDFTWKTLNAYTAHYHGDGTFSHAELDNDYAEAAMDEWGVSFQDCTSGILVTLATLMHDRT